MSKKGNKTRIIFAVTSPRTLEKIIPEIPILTDNFSGQVWNQQTQTEFYHKLSSSPFYEGKVLQKNPDFAARDRMNRAPKGLGFVQLYPIIELTEVGKNLLEGKRTHEVFARQLFKFQYPSPFHDDLPEGFNVRPYLELLRLTNELGSLSKEEIQIFGVQVTNYNKYKKVVSKIKDFREELKGIKINRKRYVDDVLTRELKIIYAEDIQKGNIATREGSDNSLKTFLTKKKGLHKDYADAFMRYLRATQLIYFDSKTIRMYISPSRSEEVEWLLKNINRNALKFDSEEAYREYLYNPASLGLLTDDKEFLKKKLAILGLPLNERSSIEQLKDLLEETEAAMTIQAVKHTEQSLKGYKEFDDVISVFGQIVRKQVIDPALYLEWNVWRSFVMMNYTKDIKGHFTVDLDGNPLRHAGGNLPDIEIEYENFKMIVEVTTSTGAKQYEMEGEPVARHFGKMQLSSPLPVYCLFVAPNINEYSFAHFYNLNRMNTKLYGGKTRIIPLTLKQFISLITNAKEKDFNNSQMLKAYLDLLIGHLDIVDDELGWSEIIEGTSPAWLN